MSLTSIIIVTHNQLDYTRLCVESILARTPEPFELIFVDNGSGDGTVEELKGLGVRGWGLEQNRPERVIVAVNAENRGFPAAANQGIRAATGEQILLLNNDTIVTTAWLRRMLRAMESNPAIGMVGPVSNFVSGQQQIEGVGSRESGVGEEGNDELRARIEEFARKWGAANDGRLIETERLVGFCLLIRREVIDRIGFFDERFGIGNFEDDDYCRRAREAGFNLVIAADSFVHHFGGRTFIGSGVDHGALMRRNERLFREKWMNGRESRVQGPGPEAADADQSSGTRPSTLSPQLSLCMIARDNERTIGAALEVIRRFVDEIVVVDTGSKDRTPEIAASLGARVFQFPWCDDFSAARNESIRHALGQWIFWMDTDDTIDEENARRVRGLAEQASRPSPQPSPRTGEEAGLPIIGGPQPSTLNPQPLPILGFLVKVRCPVAGSNGDTEFIEVDQVKVFRNLPAIRFEGRIHEQVLMAIRCAGGTVAWTDLFVTHANADNSLQGHARKLERDLRILQLEYRERPDHPFTLFNLGMTLADAGRHDEAIGFLWQSIGRSGPDESHLRKCYALLVASYRTLGRHVTAWETCQQGLVRFPNDPELQFRLATLLHQFGRLAQSATAYERLLQAPTERHLSSVDRAIKGHRARQNLAAVYTELGDFARARDELEHALAERPHDHDLLERRCQLLFEHFSAEEAESAFRALIERDPQNAAAYHNLGSILFKLGRYDESVAAYRDSIRLRPQSAATYDHLAFALRESCNMPEAVAAWKTALAIDPNDPIATDELQKLDPR